MKVDNEMFHDECEMMIILCVYDVLLIDKSSFEKSSVTTIQFNQDYGLHFANTYFFKPDS